MKDSKKRSQKRQDLIRNDLLVVLRNLVIASDEFSERVVGCWADGYLHGIRYYIHHLDLHNKCLFDNLYARLEITKEKYQINRRCHK